MCSASCVVCRAGDRSVPRLFHIIIPFFAVFILSRFFALIPLSLSLYHLIALSFSTHSVLFSPSHSHLHFDQPLLCFASLSVAIRPLTQSITGVCHIFIIFFAFSRRQCSSSSLLRLVNSASSSASLVSALFSVFCFLVVFLVFDSCVYVCRFLCLLCGFALN